MQYGRSRIVCLWNRRTWMPPARSPACRWSGCATAVSLASFVAPRFAIVTTLPCSIVPIERLVARYGMADRCTVRASGVPVLALEDPDSGAFARITAEIEAAIRDDRAEAIILGCAGMADLAQRLSDTFGLPSSMASARQ
jgi:allantoin racemase